MRRLISVLVGTVLSANPETVIARDLTPPESRTVEAYLQGVERVGSVPRQYAKAIAVDSSMKRRIGIALLFTHEDPDGVGGNTYIQKLVVFAPLAEGGAPLSMLVVGGKLNRTVTLQSAMEDRVLVDTMSYGKTDPACCPTVPSKTTFQFANGKLVEVDAKSTTPNYRIERTREP